MVDLVDLDLFNRLDDVDMFLVDGKLNTRAIADNGIIILVDCLVDCLILLL